MPNYSARFTLTLSDTVKDIAAKVGKGFDPDFAGEYSFHDNGDGTISTSTPCTEKFKEDGEYLMRYSWRCKGLMPNAGLN